MLILKNGIFAFFKNMKAYNIFLCVMVLTAIIVFISLYFIKASYGIFTNKKWGYAINNKLAWVLMEAPVCICMILLWLFSERRNELVPFVFLIIFEIHYIQRSFIFPFLIRGNSKMSIATMLMGIVFNIANAAMQGLWLFYLAPADKYTVKWLASPQFIIGTLLFFTGWIINLRSDYRIRHLRAPGDTKHYLPHGGLFNYVTSANYFGELLEWLAFAILTWSLPALVFFIWTFANLVPRAHAIHEQYKIEFAEEMEGKHLKRVFPFIY